LPPQADGANNILSNERSTSASGQRDAGNSNCLKGICNTLHESTIAIGGGGGAPLSLSLPLPLPRHRSVGSDAWSIWCRVGTGSGPDVGSVDGIMMRGARRGVLRLALENRKGRAGKTPGRGVVRARLPLARCSASSSFLLPLPPQFSLEKPSSASSFSIFDLHVFQITVFLLDEQHGLTRLRESG